jgi:outer membrane protein
VLNDLRSRTQDLLKGLVVAVLLASSPSWAQMDAESFKAQPDNDESSQVPLYELGLGGALGYLPDYPGSDEGKVRSIVLPYGIYRGDIFSADQDGGVRTQLFEGLHYELDLSFGGSFPASSADNRARKGMEDLDWLFEVGPQVTFHIHVSEKYRIQFKVPVRGVVSTNFRKTVDRGYNLTPHLVVQKRNFPYPEANFLFEWSVFYASERLSQYFFQVNPKDVTPERPQYDARPGYIGWAATAGQSFPFYSNVFYVAYRYINYNGAANRASPLFRAPENHSFGIGVIWQLYESQRKVSRK